MDATGQPAENVPPDANVLVVEVWAETAYVDSLGDAVIRRGPLDGSEEPTDNSVLSALDAVGVVWTGPRNPHGPTVVTVADVLPWLKALTKGP